MSGYFDTFAFESQPVPSAENTVIRGDTRFCILTPCLLRVENVKGAVFCDEPTQSVWNRNFSQPPFTVNDTASGIIIKTEKAEFTYSVSEKKMLKIVLSDSRTVTDIKKGNLKGTCRTLDRTDGKTRIGDGIISRNGAALLCDNRTLVLTSDGKIIPRKAYGTDEYYFAYGNDYIGAVQDFFRLTGFPPLVPRYALGNWWSRYKAYTADEYKTLMKRFVDTKIPVTVATIDMDWHWVKISARFGKESRPGGKRLNLMELFYDILFPGWTGYSWNTELFPEPKEFLKWLHDNNFKVTLNIHPAAGVRYFEDAYADFCEFMGVDKDSKKQIHFDITDPKFVEGYFKFLHHSHEKDGVNFWWIDWQQGNKTKIPGLDPLWALNHYHSLDSARDGLRPLILSRFAGAGSHRYPLGFSGDTAQTWRTLDFQPYFTSTAANIGYTWWSHDIGGHHFGYRDDELYLRWVQFGIFSPVMRLHSTSNEFMGKEPWKYRSYVCRLAEENLKLRHRLLPYIYTMNARTANKGRAISEPMYYRHPEEENAYNVPNEYYFGSELIVCPVTQPMNKKTNLAGTKCWLPKGRYTDIFNGRIYRGRGLFELYRDEESIPVLAKEGSIIPLSETADTNDSSNPEALELLLYRGNGEFTMYEDDGETQLYKEGHYALTSFALNESADSLLFTIAPVKGDTAAVPSKRRYVLSFRDVTGAASVTVYVNGKKVKNVTGGVHDGFFRIELDDILPSDSVKAELKGITVLHNQDRKELLTELISRRQGKNNPKMRFTQFVLSGNNVKLPEDLKGPVQEIYDMER